MKTKADFWDKLEQALFGPVADKVAYVVLGLAAAYITGHIIFFICR